MWSVGRGAEHETRTPPPAPSLPKRTLPLLGRSLLLIAAVAVAIAVAVAATPAGASASASASAATASAASALARHGECRDARRERPNSPLAARGRGGRRGAARRVAARGRGRRE